MVFEHRWLTGESCQGDAAVYYTGLTSEEVSSRNQSMCKRARGQGGVRTHGHQGSSCRERGGVVLDPVTSRQTVVVAGATGYIGRHIARAMHDAGYRVRALARDRNRLASVRSACDEVFVGQATQRHTLHGLCDGADVVVSALGLRTVRSRPTPETVDLKANRNILEQARRVGVRHFIFISVLQASQLIASVPILLPREQFVSQLEDSGMTWTVLRPTGSFNDMKEIYQTARHGWGVVLGKGSSRINPVHPADIADVAARAITDVSLHNSEFEFGGPDIYTASEVIELAFRALGKQPRVLHLPYWSIDALAAAVRPVNRNAAGFLAFFRQTLSRDMVGIPIGKHHLWEYYLALASRR